VTGQNINGVDVAKLGEVKTAVERDTTLGRFEFRARTRWRSGSGGQNSTSLGSFHGAGAEQNGRRFEIAADEPKVLLGQDTAPNPVEYLLSALGACITSSLIYHAAAAGHRVDDCECTLTGDLDVRGFLGIDPDVRPGYQHILVTLRVRSDAPVEELEQAARFSPVLDVVSRGTSVALRVEAWQKPGVATTSPPTAPPPQ
jgi:uncharacterized OsmC-like protein